jgi:ADP-heptose:LPS heptosyltransferase
MNWRNLFYPKKVLHALRIESHTLRILAQYGAPDVLLQFLGGIGDELLLTCVARELKKRNPAIRTWQVSPAADLLRHNSDYSHVFDMDHWHLRYSNLLNSRRKTLRYTDQPIPGEYESPPSEHILACLCRMAGIKGEIEIRTYYCQTDGEKASGRLAPRQICVHSMGEYTHETWMRNKVWYHERFQEIVDTLLNRNKDIRVIQIGVAKDPPLRGVLDLRGKTSLRQTAAILSQSECFVGTQGLLTHLARAVECRSVIIYGGREHSWQSGYICNENLDSLVECAPCWHWNECANNRICMDMIGADDVLAAVERVCARRGQALETDSYSVQ